MRPPAPPKMGYLNFPTPLGGRKQKTCPFSRLELGALRRHESLVWLATRRAPFLALHPNPAVK